MTAPETITALTAAILFGLGLIPTALRLISKDRGVFHLLLYIATGLVFNLSILITRLEYLPTANTDIYTIATNAALVLMVLAFGGLTLEFLEKGRNALISYWVTGLIIFGLWTLIATNIAGIGSALNGALGITDSTESNPATAIIAMLGWMLGIVVTIVVTALELRQHHPTQYLNRLRYWIILTALLAVGGLIYFLNSQTATLASLIAITLASLGITIIILRHQTPDLRLLIGRTIRYSGVMTILFIIYFFSLAGILVASRNGVDGPTAILLAIVIAVVLANISVPLWRFSRQFLTRIVFGKEQQDEKQIIRHYSRSISSALDMNRLGDTVINLMVETLGIEHGVVYSNQRGSTGHFAFRPLSSIGLNGEELSVGHFEANSPFIDYFRQGKKVLSQYDVNVLPQFKGMSDLEKAWLSQLKMELFVAILREREIIGFLGFGQQGQGAAYYDEDQELMIALADQAALAMDSARLFEQLSVINQEVGSLTNKLAGLDQGKSDFLSIASHELRTPLTHIHGYSRMLLDLTEEELSDPAYVKTIIEGIAKGSERMKGVIDLMFDVTEADVGEMNLFTGPVDLAEVIDNATRPFLAALDERRIAFGKTGLQDVPMIEADGTRLVQAFENLIGNAIKYTPDGGVVTVESKFIVHDGLGPAIETVVVDTGIGIDPEHQETIFEKFYRVDDTDHHSTGKTKFKGAGPGLGLTLVKGIAEAHGGKVWVESLGYDEANLPGSKFFFLVPTDQPTHDFTIPQKQSQIETRHWRSRDFGKTDEEIEQADEA